MGERRVGEEEQSSNCQIAIVKLSKVRWGVEQGFF